MPICRTIPCTVVAEEITAVSDLNATSPAYSVALKEGRQMTLLPAQCGQHTPKAGDMVIFSSPSDIYLCPQDVFKAKYEEVKA